MKKASRMRVLRWLVTFGALAAALASSPAFAQSWPERPLKFIVAAPAGSSLDVLARLIGD